MIKLSEIFNACGEASMCWKEQQTGNFDSLKAIKIAHGLYANINMVESYRARYDLTYEALCAAARCWTDLQPFPMDTVRLCEITDRLLGVECSISFVSNHPNAILPTKKYSSDSGWDIYCCEDICDEGGILVRTGLLLAGLTVGYELQVRARSSLAAKGILVVNGPGTIDNSYRGEIKVIMCRIDGGLLEFKAGDKVAQLVPMKVPSSSVKWINKVTDGERGDNGYGSTGGTK